ITSANVAHLVKAWSFAITGKAAESLDHLGSLVANPVVVGGVVYVQDMRSNVYALSLSTGAKLWEHFVGQKLLSGPGPNGVAVVGGVVYGLAPRTAFALRASDGHVVWSDEHLLTKKQGTFGMQPQVAGGRDYVASQYGSGAGGGVLIALDASNGHELWRFNTTKSLDPGVRALGLGSGGAWETPLVGTDGSVTFGTGNPYQTLGSAMTVPRAQPYTDSDVNLDAATGRLRWYYQGVPDDFKDWDMQASPIATTVRGTSAVIGGGKMGIVYAMNARTGALLWRTPVGRHNGHDDDSLDALDHRSTVSLPLDILPGSLGGILTNMAVAGGSVYVETLDLALAYTKDSQVTGDAYSGTKERGEIEALSLATGRVEWDRTFKALPLGDTTVVNDLVLTTLYGGTLVALSRATGATVASIALPTSTNAGIAVAGDTVIVPAGGPATTKGGGHPQVVAYRLTGSA
ncbi:MAG TPA: PQQ-binding-like beta-propeller repeat protein, partial [Acidimicrobiales bacterium]|nr:PQQ-binding-like beta-propeller repeat protein [Acidimicrobiales bacterium]